MALSYSSYNPSACAAQYGLNKSARAQPNPCDPSSLNPYNVTSLGDFKLSMLHEILSNERLGSDFGLCHGFANILPRFFSDINKAASDPGSLNVPALHMQSLIQRTVSSPYNNSSPGNATVWWYENINIPTAPNRAFLNDSISACIKTICKSRNFAGDADITGIGMLVSTGMLILLACVFVWPAYTVFIASKPRAKGFRAYLIKYLPEFFEAICLFTLSILVSTIIYRTNISVNMSAYNIFMAEVLSLVGSIVMVMVAASICQHWPEKDGKHSEQYVPAVSQAEKDAVSTPPRATFLDKSQLKPRHLYIFILNTVLTIVLFSLEFAIQHSDPQNQGIAAERRCLKASSGQTDIDHLGDKNVSIPACFSFWLAALVGSSTNLLRLLCPNKFAWLKQVRTPVFKAIAIVPMLFGTAALVWLVYLFCRTWSDMRIVFGQSFVNGEQDWTFGQFMAVFTWCSPLLAVGRGILRHNSKDNSVYPEGRAQKSNYSLLS